MGSFKLASTDPISITVGLGGTVHTKNASMETNYGSGKYSVPQYSSNIFGRPGTHGAVMLFWD